MAADLARAFIHFFAGIRFARSGGFYLIPQNYARTQPKKVSCFFREETRWVRLDLIDGTAWYWDVPWCSLKIAVTQFLSGFALHKVSPLDKKIVSWSLFLGSCHLPTQVQLLREATRYWKGWFYRVEVKDVQSGLDWLAVCCVLLHTSHWQEWLIQNYSASFFLWG